MSLKILIVDDDKGVRDVLQMRIRDLFPDAVVAHAANGLDAISTIREKVKVSGYDVVFTDMQMPGMNGLDLITMARGEGVTSGIILMSGIMDTELYTTAIRVGADMAFEKPKLIPGMVEAAMAAGLKAKDRRAGG